MEKVNFNKSFYKKILKNPEETIKYFDLVYINDSKLNIKRVRQGKSFLYENDKNIIKDENILNRIKSLVIPPAWEKVRVASLDNGHLQAVGRDLKSRKQYRYHPKWNKIRNQTKFYKMHDFGLLLPKIRKKVNKDLAQKTWNKSKVLALVVKLLEETHIRIGNEQYAKRNKTYGLTTLRTKHLLKENNKLRFEFTGKRGKHHKITIRNKKLIRLINKCEEIPGWELFQFYDESGIKQSVESSMINDYLHEISGEFFTAKDFRTWSASLICFETLRSFGVEKEEKQQKKNILEAIDLAAKGLGNTRNVSRKYYIHPEIFNRYNDSSISKYFNFSTDDIKDNVQLSASEKSLLRLIKSYQPVI